MVTSASQLQIGLPPAAFAEAFPFHIAFDSTWKIVALGDDLAKLSPVIKIGSRFDELFSPVQPARAFELASLTATRRGIFLIREKLSCTLLRGYFIALDNPGTWVFLGAPDATPLASQAAGIVQKLALVAERTENAVVLTDALGHIEWINASFTRITGHYLEDVRGKQPGQILHGPNTNQEVVEYTRQQIAKGEGFSVELVNYSKFGREYWVGIEMQPIKDQAGGVMNFMGIISDITERKEAELRLNIQYDVSRIFVEGRGLNETITHVLKTIGEALHWQMGILWRHDAASNSLIFLECWEHPDAACHEFIAISREMSFLRGKGLPGMVWESGEPIWLRDWPDHLALPRSRVAVQNQLHSVVILPLFVSGKFWGAIEFNSIRVNDPNSRLLKTFSIVCRQLGMFIERKLAVEEFNQTSTTHKAILTSANVSVVATFPNGIISTFNKAAERMLGYRAEEVVGKTSPAQLHVLSEVVARAKELSRELGVQIEPGFETFIAKTVRTGKPDEREWTYVRKDGSTFPVMLSVTALFDEKGGISGYVGIGDDITTRKEVERRLREAKDLAEASNRAKSEFLATMSHELRTPMNGVLGMTELLMQTSLTPRQREFAEATAQSANALLHVIDDVLDFSKIEAGKLAIAQEDFTLRSVVDAVLEIAALREPGKPLGLAAIVHRDVPHRLNGDPLRLRQVLLNLVGNAIKFTNRGEVTIRIRPMGRQQDKLLLRLEVSDTGIGLTNEQIQKLFQPFVQADTSASRRFSGTGLGLAICRRLVELMGGEIGVFGELGKGSTFWFELPFGVPAQQPVLGLSHPGLVFARIVVGAVQSSIRESLVEQLHSWGMACTLASTAEDFVMQVRAAVVKGEVTPLIICDDELLALGGERLRLDLEPWRGKVRSVLLSNPTLAITREETDFDWFGNVLLKPVKQSQLFDELVGAIEGQPGQKGLPETDFFKRGVRGVERMSLGHMRVLLAEDHPINRKLCQLMLEGLGVRPDTAVNGAEAVRLCRDKEYDVILMDCNMPELDGYGATGEIRKLEATRSRKTRIVALTANALIGERERCLEAGMDDYLTKPFTSSQLEDTLRATPIRPPAETVESGFAVDRLEELCRELDATAVMEMAGEFATDLPARLAELEQLLSEQKWPELHRHAHSLKGVAASFGLDPLASVFTNIEAAAKIQNLEETVIVVKPLQATAEKAKTALQQWLAKKSLKTD